MEREFEADEISIKKMVKSEKGIELLSDLTGLSIEDTRKAAERIRHELGLTFDG